MAIHFKSNPSHALRSSHAFTLVELLVVVAIIALLISILLPALNKARDVARQVTCQTNMHQLMLGMHMYADDNTGYLPPVSTHINPLVWKGVSRDAYVPWYSAMFLGPYINNDRIGATAYSTNEQGSSSNVIYCPAQGKHSNNTVGIGYSNLWNNKISKTNGGPTPLPQFTFPALMLIFADVTGTGSFQYIYENSSSSNIPSFRHVGNTLCNVAFADGHTDAFPDLQVAFNNKQLVVSAR